MRRFARNLLKLSLGSTGTLLLVILVVEFCFRFVPLLDRFVTFDDSRVLGKNLGERSEHQYLASNAKFVYKGHQVGTVSEFKVSMANS